MKEKVKNIMSILSKIVFILALVIIPIILAFGMTSARNSRYNNWINDMKQKNCKPSTMDDRGVISCFNCPDNLKVCTR